MEQQPKLYRNKYLVEVVGTYPNGDVILQSEGQPNYQWKVDKITFEMMYVKARPRIKKTQKSKS